MSMCRGRSNIPFTGLRMKEIPGPIFMRIDTPWSNCRELRFEFYANGNQKIAVPMCKCSGERFKGPCVWRKIGRVLKA